MFVKRGHMNNPTANNRESPRIAFSLRCLLVLVVLLLGRVPTLRLIGSAWPERQRGKCWKTRVAGFLLKKSCPLLLLQVFENLDRKPATRVFQHFSFRRPDHAEPMRRSVGTRPKVKRAEQEKCDSRRFAIACKPKACVPPQMGFAHLGLFAVEIS